MKRTRRFIAGAVCPKCRELDRIVLEAVDGEGAFRDGQRDVEQVQRRCVSCGFTELMVSQEPADGVVLPRARFERNKELAGAPPTKPQVVRLIDPKA